MKLKRLVTILLVCIAIFLSGCGIANETAGQNQKQTKYLDEAGFQKEYRDATVHLELPPAIFFPDEANTGGAQSFEEGCGVSFAQQYWIYAWQVEWLEQRNRDREREDVAINMLKNVIPECEFMREKIDEAGRRLYYEYLRKAELGDPGGFQHDVSVNPMKLERALDD